MITIQLDHFDFILRFLGNCKLSSNDGFLIIFLHNHDSSSHMPVFFKSRQLGLSISFDWKLVRITIIVHGINKWTTGDRLHADRRIDIPDQLSSMRATKACCPLRKARVWFSRIQEEFQLAYGLKCVRIFHVELWGSNSGRTQQLSQSNFLCPLGQVSVLYRPYWRSVRCVHCRQVNKPLSTRYVYQVSMWGRVSQWEERARDSRLSLLWPEIIRLLYAGCQPLKKTVFFFLKRTKVGMKCEVTGGHQIFPDLWFPISFTRTAKLPASDEKIGSFIHSWIGFKRTFIWVLYRPNCSPKNVLLIHKLVTSFHTISSGGIQQTKCTVTWQSLLLYEQKSWWSKA